MTQDVHALPGGSRQEQEKHTDCGRVERAASLRLEGGRHQGTGDRMGEIWGCGSRLVGNNGWGNGVGC